MASMNGKGWVSAYLKKFEPFVDIDPKLGIVNMEPEVGIWNVGVKTEWELEWVVVLTTGCAASPTVTEVSGAVEFPMVIAFEVEEMTMAGAVPRVPSSQLFVTEWSP